jgi:adhesin transport system membrane fusion protein
MVDRFPRALRADRRPFVVLSSTNLTRRHVESDLPALRLVQSPAPVRRVALALALMFPMLAFVLLFVPWQQTALGTGEVIAYAPEGRRQAVESPVAGRIVEWHVQEGDIVQAGDPLVTLGDNDPDFLARLQAERTQVEAGLEAAREQARTYRLEQAAEETARDLAVAEYEAKIEGERRKRLGEEADAEAAALQLARIEALAAEGIESTRKLELARARAAKAAAAVQARDQVIAAAENARDKAARSGDAKVAKSGAALQGAVAKEAESRAKLIQFDVKLARQAQQIVTAPRDGVVFRVEGGPTARQVKKGSELLELVPTGGELAVALHIDGNDMPLVRPGEDVRVLFEGWPALQFSGWPGMSFGTFGGEVAFVDATDDGKGKFRILVTADPDDGGWPAEGLLRQGVRAKGFVMLGRVPLGYELWRQINGFPPLPPVEKGDKVTPPNNKKPRSPSVLK